MLEVQPINKNKVLFIVLYKFLDYIYVCTKDTYMVSLNAEI